VDNFAGQLDAAAGVELLELELELEPSDLADSDFFSDALEDSEDSELFAEPLVVVLADSRLSVR
jgi:hypothetical protein